MLEGLAVAAMIMAGLGIILSAVLAVANKSLYVFEDPRIDDVEEMLPGANCGACGYAGCRAFAEALVEGKAQPAQCSVNSPEMTEKIAAYLGVKAGTQVRRVARLACAGGNNVARRIASYEGVKTCRAAAIVGGGGKACVWGCLGYGDCMEVCDFGAITMNENDLPVVDEDKCTACGACVEECPRDLFTLLPVNQRLWVACKNEAPGDEAEAVCSVACTGCGRCAMDAPNNMISIVNNLARVDYSKWRPDSKVAIERCPTGAIVWLDRDVGPVKGTQARRVTRKSSLPVG
ncbi:MAG: RnfABCDGE type electron transport complex subunit B [Candidatus Hydrogenedentota bacterium]